MTRKCLHRLFGFVQKGFVHGRTVFGFAERIQDGLQVLVHIAFGYDVIDVSQGCFEPDSLQAMGVITATDDHTQCPLRSFQALENLVSR